MELLKVICKRLGLVFLAWFVLYAVLPVRFPVDLLRQGFSRELADWLAEQPAAAWSWIALHPLTFWMQGTATHLWFLVSLMMALALVAIFPIFKKDKLLLLTAALLFGAALLGKPYVSTPWGIPFPDQFNPRNGPFFSTLFVVLGYFIAKMRRLPSRRFAVCLMVGGFLWHMAEVFFLWEFFSAPFYGNDFVLGTIPFGAGVFLTALTNPGFGKGTVLPQWGEFTLGIYVSHYYVLVILSIIHRDYFKFPGPVLWQVLFPLAGYLGSLGLVFLMRKNKAAEILVS